jgi:hypothetical protein
LDRSLTGSQVALLPVQHDLHYSFCADSFAPPGYHRLFPSIVLTGTVSTSNSSS